MEGEVREVADAVDDDLDGKRRDDDSDDSADRIDSGHSENPRQGLRAAHEDVGDRKNDDGNGNEDAGIEDAMIGAGEDQRDARGERPGTRDDRNRQRKDRWIGGRHR